MFCGKIRCCLTFCSTAPYLWSTFAGGASDRPNGFLRSTADPEDPPLTWRKRKGPRSKPRARAVDLGSTAILLCFACNYFYTQPPLLPMITTRDPYEGIVLRHLIKHDDPVRVTEIGDKLGHFCLNDDAFLLVKYSSRDRSPWRFTFRPDDIRTLIHDQNQGGLFGGSYVCLVCGLESLCALREEEWSTLLDLTMTEGQQTITVRRDPQSSFEVAGSSGKLDRKVPASRFPGLIFE